MISYRGVGQPLFLLENRIMNGKFIYYSIVSLFGVLCSLQSFFLFFLLFVIYIFALYKYKQFPPFQLLLMIAFFLLFLGSSQLASFHNKSSTFASASLFDLEFIDDPMIDGDQLQIKVQNTKKHEQYLLRYQIQSEKEKILLQSSNFYGRTCRITGTLEKPKQAKNENAFNYRLYLQRNSIFWLLESKNNPLENCTPKKLNALSFLKQVRFKGIRYLETHFPSEVAALSSALIYGDRSLMPQELLTNYQRAGISHLLAISGLHVTLLVGMIFYIGIRVGATRETMNSLLLFFLPIYAILTGGSPSVLRAVVMIFLVMVTLKWKRRLKLLPIDALSIAFSLFLLLRPFVVFNIGFQLSFAVSGAIILSSASILQQSQSNIIRLIMTSVVSQLSALPFIFYDFFEVSLLSILINLLYIPLFSYIFLPGVYILSLFQFLFGTVPSFFMDTFALVVHFSDLLIQIMGKASFAKFTPGRPGILFLVLDILLLIFIFILMEKPKLKGRMKVIFSLCFIILFLPTVWSHLNPYGQVSMIDVGQGDSILIQLPFGKANYLIDTGGTLQFHNEAWKRRSKTFETGKDIVVPFLKGKGITSIDKMILTHGDTDHIGGAFAVMKEIKIKQIILPDVKEKSETEKEIISEAEKKGIQIVFVSEGNQWKQGANRFVILSPESNFSGERNRGSVVVLARIGGINWFFGGDLDQQGEEEIVRKFPNIHMDILKVGHHGSRTSSSDLFLNRYKPKVSLISAGEKNRFGHPHKEVVEKLTKIGSSILRTDLNGEISYRFFNEKGTFFTYLP